MILFLQLVLPEYGIHLFISLLLLAGGQWTAFIFNLPLLIYNIFRYSRGLQYFALLRINLLFSLICLLIFKFHHPVGDARTY